MLKKQIELLKIYWEIMNILKEAKMEIKEGKKTSEFKLVVVLEILLVLAGLVGYLPKETVAIILACLTALYTILRTIYKMTATKIDDIIVEKLEKIIEKVEKEQPK